MKLMELTGIKHLKNKTPKELVNYISSFKLNLLGSGASGIALTDGSTVFKFWHRDSGYEKFVKFCQSKTDNPYLPKFKSDIKKLNLDIKSSGADIIELEREYDLEIESDPESMPEVIGVKYIKIELLSPCKYSDVFFGIELGDIVENIFHDSLDDLTPSPDNKDAFLKFSETISELKDILGTDESFDGSIENFMRRGDTLVILDPICNSADIVLNRFLFGEDYAKD